MVKNSRTYPAPERFGGDSYTLDELERFSATESDFGAWAGKTYRRERDILLASLCVDSKLPYYVEIDDGFGTPVVVALKYSDSEYLTASGWVESLDEDDVSLTVATADDAAFVARAFKDGIDRVYFRPVVPVAFIDDVAPITAAAEVPAGSRTLAVVDELDKNAVIELIAIAPGPVVYRRHDGEWREDPLWISALRSVKPPPLVTVADDLLQRVIEQVDETTAGEPFGDEEKAATASGILGSIIAADVEIGIQAALTAAKNPAKGAAGAERLRQYWLTGKGAAKIRWGTKGAWTRCYKYLSKYMGTRAKGYCQLMHGRATGTWAGRGHSKVPSPAVKAKAIAKQLGK